MRNTSTKKKSFSQFKLFKLFLMKIGDYFRAHGIGGEIIY